MPTTTTNVSFQKWADNEEPWEQRTDWDKLDDIFSGVTTVPAFATEQATINDLSAVLEKTANQAISADTDTTVDWDNQDVDTDLYTYDAVNDDIDVLEAGDYVVGGQIDWTDLADQDSLVLKILVNGTRIRQFSTRGSGTGNQGLRGLATLKDLAVNDTIRFDVRTGAANTVIGATHATFMTITRSG